MQYIEPGDEPVRNIMPPAPPPPAPAPAPPPPPPLPPLPDPATWSGGHVGQGVIAELIAEGYPTSVVAQWAAAANAHAEAVTPLITPPPPAPPPAPEPPPAASPPPAAAPVDGSGDGGDDRSLESAYKPAGVKTVWRDLIDVFKTDLPKNRGSVISVLDTPKELFR